MTFGQVKARTAVIAHWAQAQGVAEGTSVALFMSSRVEVILVWLGIAKARGATALINTNLRGLPLAHSLRASGATVVIVGAELAQELAELLEEHAELGATLKVWVMEDPATPGQRAAAWPKFLSLDKHLESHAEETEWDNKPVAIASTPLLYIYTSGTTGLPKPAKVTHARFLAAGIGFSALFAFRRSDRVYCALPLYHTAGGVLGVGCCLASGATLVIRRKFSATHFWEDIAKHKCTIFQYIGELCRYLVAQPPREGEKAHSVRLALGNGLRPDVWKTFQERFEVPLIGEFYGASEGNCTLVNTENKFGAVGIVTPLMKKLYPVALVKYDVETDSIVYDKVTGRPVLAAPGEPGELLGKIIPRDPVRSFDGYINNPAATDAKVVRGVVKPGDRWFRSGDLLRQDEEGFFYFVDRIGDTFRWKGENVATSEVAEVVALTEGVAEANVYGVKVPGIDEGRAGMVALSRHPDRPPADLKALAELVKKELPSYARPLFVRMLSQPMEITGTFKHTKTELRTQGADPALCAPDQVFFLLNGSEYVPLSSELYDNIRRGQVRL